MNPNDPYHGYYLRKSHELQEGGQEAITKLSEEMQTAETSDLPVPAEGKTTTAEMEEVEPERPDELFFTINLPNISPLDL